MGIGPWELVVILLVVVIIFGVGRLPELGTGLGEGIKNFKKAMLDTKNLDGSAGSSENSEKKKVE